jgi:uncharacterized membrane protein YtjA (UPF0391 family)
MRWSATRESDARPTLASAVIGHPCEKGIFMIYWAAVFLVIALVAGLLGMGGIAGIIVAVVFLVKGRGANL